MPPPSRFRQAVVSPPAAAVCASPFVAVLSHKGYSPVSVDVAADGNIRSIESWRKIFFSFAITVSPEVLGNPHDEVTTEITEPVMLVKLMSLIVDTRSGMAVDTLRANQAYGFDRAGAVEAFPPVVVPEATALPDVRPVGFVYDALMLKHEAPDSRIPEAPVRVERAHAALVAHPLIGLVLDAHRIQARPATTDEITLVHDAAIYRSFLDQNVPLGEAVMAPLKSDVYACSATAAAVRLACGASIDACKWVWDFAEGEPPAASREPVAAFALIRPPGHHCSKDTPSGFCIANNAVVAAENLRRHVAGSSPQHHRTRIAIIDLDVHHGEGTQALVEDDPETLYISTHRFDEGAFYPCGSAGGAEHVGPHHTIVNIPFNTAAADPERCHAVISDLALVRAWERIILPQLEAFTPELIIVSLGFDAAYGDPLGKMSVEGGFAVVLRKLMQWCSAYSFTVNGGGVACRGVVCLLEGGYQPSVVAARTCECFEALLRWQDRGKSAEEQRVHEHPKSWGDVRRKQERKLSEYTALTSAAEVDKTSATEPDKKVHPVAPPLVPTDAELWEKHVGWVEASLHHVIDARAQQRR